MPEEAEKAVERENIKELIIDKDREIKELPAVSIDESVNKVSLILITRMLFDRFPNADSFSSSYDFSCQHYLLINRCRFRSQYPVKILD